MAGLLQKQAEPAAAIAMMKAYAPTKLTHRRLTMVRAKTSGMTAPVRSLDYLAARAATAVTFKLC
jgi:hypothetical protein